MADLLSDEEFDLFRNVIYKECGISFSDTNRSILDSRLHERLRDTGIPTVKDYYNKIISDGEEMKIMLDSITTNLTRFFRNQAHFDTLTNYVIPELVNYKKSRGETTINVWSAGCSTGEEPYSIAMLLKDILPAPFTFKIIASDLSLKSLMVGQAGFYPESRIVGIPDNYLKRFFDKVEGGYQAKKDLMSTIRFDYHNLKNDSGLRNLDIVFCRNVLIYFDEAAQLAVVNRFWDALSPKSFLFIGHSESLFGMNTKFQFLKTDWACIYQKNI
ncbi:MAG: protein-glutamate O-methyltransferase CheR [Spirochaetaceae bacterium]|nr:protein-glutamate O-methyltransferase CheR [Spirochaetaceae bacterium]